MGSASRRIHLLGSFAILLGGPRDLSGCHGCAVQAPGPSERSGPTPDISADREVSR
jgi:hypothetical protein